MHTFCHTAEYEHHQIPVRPNDVLAEYATTGICAQQNWIGSMRKQKRGIADPCSGCPCPSGSGGLLPKPFSDSSLKAKQFLLPSCLPSPEVRTLSSSSPFTQFQKPLPTRIFLHHFQNAHGLKAWACRTSKISSTQRMLCLYMPYPLVDISKCLLPRHLSISSIHLRLFVAGCGSW